MSATPGKNGDGHILILPYMARGHHPPVTALAQRLVERTSFQITFVSTPLNVKFIRDSLPAGTSIAFAELPFRSTDHGLPPGVENTTSTPPHLIINIFKASATLQPAFEELVADISLREGRPPVAIIADGLLSWSVEAARKFGSLHYSIIVPSACGMLWLVDLLTAEAHHQDPAKPDIMRKVLARSQDSDAVLANSVEELEQEALEQLRRVWKRVWAVGPLIPTPPPSVRPSCPELKWLDRQPPGSVLYISFGSEARVHPWQMLELAKGVNASGKSFIWVIRRLIGVDHAVEEEGLEQVEWLPKGFWRQAKESDRGLLLTKWAPQMEILSHESVGAFLSHCGWNAVLESLSGGVPIIGLPLLYEQPITLKHLEEKLGVAVKLAVGIDEDFRGSDVERAIREVMDGESEIRRKAKEMKEIITRATMHSESFTGSSAAAMDELINHLHSWLSSSSPSPLKDASSS